MQDLAIYGSGGLGIEIYEYIKAINKIEKTWNFLGFFDDTKTIGETVYENTTVLGGKNEINAFDSPLNLVIGTGYIATREMMFNNISNPHISYPNIIHPLCNFYDNVNLGKGNVFGAFCLISCLVDIGDFNLFNGHVVVGHHVNIGSMNVFSPQSTICGSVNIGNSNYFGVNSTVIEKCVVKDKIKLAANSLLLKKADKEDALYIGVPATRTSF